MSEPALGVIYLGIGRAYADLALLSIAQLRRLGYVGAIRVMTDAGRRPFEALDCEVFAVSSVLPEDAPQRKMGLADIGSDTLSAADRYFLRQRGYASRHYKTQLNRIGFEATLLLDADAVPVAPLGRIWRELRHADLCMTLDAYPTLLHRNGRTAATQWQSPEDAYMYELGLAATPHYSSGVMLFRRTPRVEQLFEVWHEEWNLFQQQDQLALMRAIERTRCPVHTLAPRWNALQAQFSSLEEARAAGTRILHLSADRRVIPASLLAAPKEEARRLREVRRGTRVEGRRVEARPGGEQRRLSEERRRAARGRRLRVLICTNTFFPRVGGQEAFVERMTEHLSESCDVGLATRGNLWYPGEAPMERFAIADDDAPTPEERWQSVCASLRRIVACFEPDVVHFGSARESIYQWALRRKIPAVATIHGNDLTGGAGGPGNGGAGAGDSNPRTGDSNPETSPLIQSLNACCRVFPTGPYTASLVRDWGVTAPATIHTPGCDIDFFQPRAVLGQHARASLGIAPDVPLVLTVSRLAQRKGHLNVLGAMRQLPFPAQWVVVGDGPCRPELLAAVDSWGMSRCVQFLGQVSEDDLLALYNGCDVFVLTPEERRLGGSLDSEGFGLVFHEAGACGKPVVGSDVSGCRDSVVDGRTGFLVPPADPGALSRTLTFLLTHPQVAEALGHCGLETVRSLGGWSRLARGLVREYQEITSPLTRGLPAQATSEQRPRRARRAR
jgi:glycosyltransferase involved in cell wall biosynthesis